MDGKYDFRAVEAKLNGYWKDLYKKRREKRAGAPVYFYLDGPPYANAPPHVGHARTRGLRDPILRYMWARGKDVWCQPGFDCHGLPIEIKIEEELGTKTKEEIEKYGLDRFALKCREHATKFLKLWTEFYTKYGMSTWDLANPYLTLTNDYIDSSWHFFRKANEKKLLYKAKATTAWCPRCETPMSGYEVTEEYKDVTDTSIYVRFPLPRKKNEYLLVWTTTPWTLPGNVAISLNPKFDYAKVSVGKDTYIMAKALVERVMGALGISDYKITGELKGKELEGAEYGYVLSEEVSVHKKMKHKIIMADFVTLEDGTGCVHTAPGHGPEDYSAGVKYKLPLLCPVNEKGEFTDEGGKYRGTNVFKANEAIIADLEKDGFLVHSDKITHRYAHCWRCKRKLIYRTSDQWFVAVDPIKGKMLEDNAKIKWVPDWAGAKRFHDWVLNARDWCISRQRYWGIPLPIWVCRKCGKEMIFGSVDELKQRATGALPADLHRPWIDAVKVKCDCGGTADRVQDIADVWFDSGAASWASLGYPKNKAFENMFPADFITEGLDQTRGWFYTLMVEGVGVFGRAPYESVLMNGLVLDAKGEKMSKSKGNVVDPFECISRYGADALRWYILIEVNPWEDVKFSFESLENVARYLGIFWNAHVFANKYFGLDGFEPTKHKLDYNELEPEDRWILSRLQSTNKAISSAYEGLNPYDAAHAMRDFVVNDLSRDYIKYIRNRLKTGKKKEIAYAVLYKVLREYCLLSAPITPYMAEEVWLGQGGRESVHLQDWPALNEKLLDNKLEERMALAHSIMESVGFLRNSININLRQPLKTLAVMSADPEAREAVAQFAALLADQCNVKEVRFVTAKPKGFEERVSGNITIYLDKTMDASLLKEGANREVVRRVQEMRKAAGLKEADRVVVEVIAEEDFTKMLDAKDIASKTGATAVSPSQAQSIKGDEREWDIGGRKVKIVLKK